MSNLIDILARIDPRYYYTVLIIIIVFLIRWILKKIIKHNIDDISQRYRWYKINTYSTFLIAFIFILPMWISGFKSIFTFFGLFSAGLAIALRDVVVNIFGWLYILGRRPFKIGDRIEVNGVKGDVIDIKILEFSLMEVGNWVEADQSTGRIVNIPNGKSLNNNIANFTQGFQFIWNELSVLITYESNWKKAKSILKNIADEHSIELNKDIKESIVHSARKRYQTLTPIVYTSITLSGIQLTVRYLCDPRQRRTSSEIFWEEILEKFNKSNEIDFAYQTYRSYNQEIKNLIDFKKENREVQNNEE